MAYQFAAYEIGDAVRMEMDAETRGWGGNHIPNGTIGHIVGYNWMIDYAERFGLDCYSYPTPGIYEKRVSLKVLWPDGTHSTEQYTQPVDKEKHDRLYNERWRPAIKGKGRNNMKTIERALTREQRIGDLPHTDLWQGDIALIKFNGEKRYALITSVQYRNLYATMTDKKTLMHGHALYDFRFCDENGIDTLSGGSWCGTNNAKLYKRGHVWKYYNGEPMVFRDLQEEAAFYTGLHHYDEVRNPESGFFAWTPDEAIAAVRSGLADGFAMPTGFFGMPPRPSLRLFHDRGLGERIRQATIKGFEGVTHLPDPREKEFA